MGGARGSSLQPQPVEDPDPTNYPSEQNRGSIETMSNSKKLSLQAAFTLGEDQNTDNLRTSTENQIESYLHNLEKQIERANVENLAVLEENKDLKTKLLEMTEFVKDREKSKEETDSKIRANLQLLLQNNEMLKKENEGLREQMKTQISDKTEMLDKMQKYDELVEELKNYNQELLSTVKQYEEQNKLLKQQAVSSENLDKFKQSMAEYEKKIGMIEEIQKAYEEEKLKTKLTEEKYSKAMEINEILNGKIDEMQKEMVALQTGFKKALDEENGTKEKIAEMIERLQGQLEEAQTKNLQKDEEIKKLIEVIEVGNEEAYLVIYSDD